MKYTQKLKCSYLYRKYKIIKQRYNTQMNYAHIFSQMKSKFQNNAKTT